MPRLYAASLAAPLAAIALALPGAALAAPPPAPAPADWRTTTVDLPDGSKAEIRYVGDIPPRVTVTMPVVQEPRSGLTGDVIDEADGGIPRARRTIQASPLRAAPSFAPPPQFIIAGDTAKGSTYNYTLITTGIDGRVCSQHTEWTSRGRKKEPRIRRSDTGEGCAGLPPPPPPVVSKLD